MRLLVKNAILATGEQVDILLDGGFICDVAPVLDCDCDEFDAHGLTVAPGLVDMHVHLRDPGFTHKEDIKTGTTAAAAGGVTTVCCMPNTSPAADNVEVLRYIAERARNVSRIRVLPIAAVTHRQKGEELVDFRELSELACAFSDDGMPVMNSEIMRRALLAAAETGKPIISHCEDLNFTGVKTACDYGLNTDIPIETDEESMAARDIALSLETGAPVHLAHVSTANTVALVRYAKSVGAQVTCETCPHYMLLTSEALRRNGSNAKMNPPLRTEADRLAILDGLCDGTIDAIVTDHAPHTVEEKASINPPNGIIGLETLLSGALTALRGRMPLSEIICKMTVNSARILGFEYGELRAGAPADLALFDLNERWVCNPDYFKSKSRNTPFGGFEFTGKVKYTFANGQLVYNSEV